MVGVRDTLDQARHEAPRGAPMAQALGDVAAAVDRAWRAVAATDPAVRTPDADPGRAASGDHPVARAEAVVAGAVARALEGLAGAEEELAALHRLVQADQAMDAVVADWDAAGSQAERRASLSARAVELDRLGADLAAAPAVPPACPALRDHRVVWASLVASRTRELAATATATTGNTYDRLRAAYRAAPYDGDRLALDAGDRGCWETASAVTAAASDVRAAVDGLEAALSPHGG
jgi:hypothetical protein